MIISKPLKFWFIHNPKVAGSSVRKCLLRYNTSEIELWHQRYIESLDRIIDMSHMAASDARHVLEVPDDYFRFGFVRNPYSRFFSSIREHIRQNQINLDTRERLSEFVLNKLTHTSVRFDWNYSHFCPQHYFFYIGKKCVADFIGRHETLDQDWAKVLTLIDLPYEDHGLDKERFSGAEWQDPAEWLTDEALARVNSIYCKDWLLFDHLFTEPVIGGFESGTHKENVHNFRSVEGRMTFYGEPPGLSLPEKVGFLTGEVERLRRSLEAVTAVCDHLNDAKIRYQEEM